MSILGAHIRDRRAARLVRSTHAEPLSPGARGSPDNTPYRLLWSAGLVAFVLCVVAFVLWGTNGAGTLFDMMVAFCT